nr:RNA-directed DNA polymerase, eukaryota [Tanacetum cinerariifolium]
MQFNRFASTCITLVNLISLPLSVYGDNLLSWSSKRQQTISRSSVEAEYRGVANVVAETAWLHNLLRELHSPLFAATLVYCDNVSATYQFNINGPNILRLTYILFVTWLLLVKFEFSMCPPAISTERSKANISFLFEDSDDAISNDEGDKNQNSNIFGDDDDAEDGREHQVNEDPIKEGKEDSCFHSKRLCVHTTNPRSISEDFKIIFRGKVYWIRAKETPGWVPDFADAYGDEDSDDAISNDEGDKKQNLNIFGDDDDAEDGREHQVNEDLIEEGEYVHSDAVGNSGCILCVWDPICYYKENFTKSDSFVMIRGVWRATGVKLMIIAVYAPHEQKEKHLLWDYLEREIKRWDGEVVTMGDFNEVRNKCERLGSVFNASEANVFNSFIVGSGLAEVVLGGSKFTWCHKSGSKMSKLDRFLIFENLMYTYPNINAITLPRYLFDHCPIFLREISHDYGSIPFKVFHYWFDIDGFNNLVEGIWKGYQSKELNPIIFFIGKLKVLKRKICEWNNSRRSNDISLFSKLKLDLESIDEIINRGDGNDKIMCKRSGIINNLNDLSNIQTMEVTQKTKIR